MKVIVESTLTDSGKESIIITMENRRVHMYIYSERNHLFIYTGYIHDIVYM